MQTNFYKIFIFFLILNIPFQSYSADFEWIDPSIAKKDHVMTGILPNNSSSKIPVICRGMDENGIEVIGVVRKVFGINSCYGRGVRSDSLWPTKVLKANVYQVIASKTPISVFENTFKRRGYGRAEANVWAYINLDSEGTSKNFTTNWTYAIYLSVSSFSQGDSITPVCGVEYENEVYIGFVNHKGHCVSSSLTTKKGSWANYFILTNTRLGVPERSGWYPQLPGANYRNAYQNQIFNYDFDYSMNSFGSLQFSKTPFSSPDRILCRTKMIDKKYAVYIESNENTDFEDIGGLGYLSNDGLSCIYQGIVGNVIGKSLYNNFEVYGSSMEFSPVKSSSGGTIPVDSIEVVNYKQFSVPICYGLTAAGVVTGFLKEDNRCHAITTDGLNIVVTSDYYFLRPTKSDESKIKNFMTGFSSPKSLPSKPHEKTMAVPDRDMVQQFSEPGEICHGLEGASAKVYDAKVSAALGASKPLGHGQLFSICNEMSAGLTGEASGSITSGGEASGRAEAIIRSQFEFSGHEELGMGVLTTHTAEIETNLGANAEAFGSGCWNKDCVGSKFAGGVFVGSTVGVSGRGDISSSGNKLGAGAGLDSPGALGAAFSGGAEYQDGIVTVGIGGSVDFLLAGLSLQLEFAVNTNTVMDGVVYAQYLTEKGPIYIGYGIKDGAVVAAREVSESIMLSADKVADGIVYSTKQLLFQSGKYLIVSPKLLTSGLVTVKNGMSYVGRKLNKAVVKSVYPAASQVAANGKVAVYSIGRAADLGGMKIYHGIEDVTKDMASKLLVLNANMALDGAYEVENAARDVYSASRKAGSYVSGKVTDLGKTFSNTMKDGVSTGWSYAKIGGNEVKNGLKWFGGKVGGFLGL